MPVVAIVNRKGGSGKSTLAVHLAAYCATQHLPVLLADADPNQSTQTWLRLRGLRLPDNPDAIAGRMVDLRQQLRPPAGTHHVVLDTEGGLHSFELTRVCSHADVVLIPVCHAVFDRQAAAACWAELRQHPRVRSGRCQVAAVGMRVQGGAQSEARLQQWAAAQDLPFIGALRDNQSYTRCIERGLTLFDLNAAKLAFDLSQWAPILAWLKPRWLDKLDPSEVAHARHADQRIHRPIDRGSDRPAADSLRPVGITLPGDLAPVPARALPARRPDHRPSELPRGTVAPSASALPHWRTRLGQVFGMLPLRRFLSGPG